MGVSDVDLDVVSAEFHQVAARLLQVNFGELDFGATTDSLTKLMGKGEAQARRDLMELRGNDVEIDV